MLVAFLGFWCVFGAGFSAGLWCLPPLPRAEELPHDDEIYNEDEESLYSNSDDEYDDDVWDYNLKTNKNSQQDSDLVHFNLKQKHCA